MRAQPLAIPKQLPLSVSYVSNMRQGIVANADFVGTRYKTTNMEMCCGEEKVALI
jgi:hypothetical protein